MEYFYAVEFSRYTLPGLAVVILGLCLVALLRRKPQPLGNVQIIDSVTGEQFPLTSRETSLGSHKDCDIRLEYDSVAKHHAVIICGKDGWYIKETGKDISPVIVNGKNIDKQEMINTGDKILLGNIELYFDNRKS